MSLLFATPHSLTLDDQGILRPLSTVRQLQHASMHASKRRIDRYHRTVKQFAASLVEELDLVPYPSCDVARALCIDTMAKNRVLYDVTDSHFAESLEQVRNEVSRRDLVLIGSAPMISDGVTQLAHFLAPAYSDTITEALVSDSLLISERLKARGIVVPLEENKYLTNLINRRLKLKSDFTRAMHALMTRLMVCSTTMASPVITRSLLLPRQSIHVQVQTDDVVTSFVVSKRNPTLYDVIVGPHNWNDVLKLENFSSDPPLHIVR
jgi:hypothetical protein